MDNFEKLRDIVNVCLVNNEARFVNLSMTAPFYTAEWLYYSWAIYIIRKHTNRQAKDGVGGRGNVNMKTSLYIHYNTTFRFKYHAAQQQKEAGLQYMQQAHISKLLGNNYHAIQRYLYHNHSGVLNLKAYTETNSCLQILEIKGKVRTRYWSMATLYI